MPGAILAFPLAFIAAKNVVGQRIVHFLSRRFLDTIHGVDTLIWALIFINVVGLGPFAGILAVAISEVGSFGKLFSEAIETADTKPVDGVTPTGGSTLGVTHTIRLSRHSTTTPHLEDVAQAPDGSKRRFALSTPYGSAESHNLGIDRRFFDGGFQSPDDLLDQTPGEGLLRMLHEQLHEPKLPN